MKNIFRHISGFALLLLFLFPMVDKELHTLAHAGDFSCSSEVTHFHEYQHTCSVCDFIFSPVINQPDFLFEINVPVISVNKSLLFPERIFSGSHSYFSLRGPPQFS